MRSTARALAALSLASLVASAPPWVGVAAAQDVLAKTGADAVSPEALRVWKALSEVKTLQASFLQVRISRILTRPMESRGIIRFSQPDTMAWIVEQPVRSTFILDGARMRMDYPDLGVGEEVDLADDEELASLVQATLVWLGGDLERVRRDYTVEWLGGTPAVVRLKPKLAALSAVIASLELTIEGEPVLIRQVRITEPDGDTVEIRFDDVRLGEALPADAFQLP